MTITKLFVEFQSGAVEAEINLQAGGGHDLIMQLIDALNSNLHLRRSGAEFEGRIRKIDGENSGWVSWSEGWLVDDAEILLDSLQAILLSLQSGGRRGSSERTSGIGPRPPSPPPTLPDEEASEPKDSAPVVVDRTGWISRIMAAESGLSETLRNHGISTDEQYLELESDLPSKQRIALAQGRFEYGVSQARNPSVPGGVDLQVLAVFAPPWVDSIPLHLPGFPVRGRNCLSAAGVKHFSQLAQLSLERLLEIPSFGRLTYQQIATSLLEHLMSDAIAALQSEPLNTPTSDSRASGESPDFSSFTAVWEAVTGLIDSESDIDVLRRRIGLGADEGPETLESIAQSREITRERVRQIQQRAIDRLHSLARFGLIKSSLEAEIGRQIAWNQASVYLGDECPMQALKGAPFETIKAFFLLILRSEFKVLITLDGSGARSARILRGLGEGELKDAIRQLEEFITQNDQEPRSRFMPMVQGFIKSSFDESIHADLKTFVDEWINWDYSADPKILSFGDSIEAAAAAVLGRSTRPLKLSELIEIAQNDFGLDQTENSIRNMLNNLCSHPGRRTRKDVCIPVFQTGRSEFGTTRHLPIQPDQLGYLIPTLQEIIAKGRECLIPGQPYQWHANCLWEELKVRHPENELIGVSESERWRAVDCLLRFHEPDGVVNLKKGRWIQEVPGSKQEARTRDEAVLWLLQNHFKSSRASRPEIDELLLKVQSPGVGNFPTNAKSAVRSDGNEYWIDN